MGLPHHVSPICSGLSFPVTTSPWKLALTSAKTDTYGASHRVTWTVYLNGPTCSPAGKRDRSMRLISLKKSRSNIAGREGPGYMIGPQVILKVKMNRYSMFPYLNFCIQDEWIVNLLFYVIFFSCADLRNFGPSLFLQFKKFYFQTLRQNSEARNQLTSHDWRHMTGVKPSKRSYILIVMNSDEHTSLQLSLIRDFFNISHNAKPAYIDIQPCVVVERSIPVSSVQHSWSLNNFLVETVKFISTDFMTGTGSDWLRCEREYDKEWPPIF